MKKEKVEKENQKEKVEEPKEQYESYDEAYPAKVVELLGRTGSRGEVMQIRCKVLAGRDQGKVLRRNVLGPVRVGDILMLKETVLEAAPLTVRRR